MNTNTYKNISEYTALFPKNVQDILNEIRKIIKEEAPTAEEAIKYQMPTFVLQGNLVHFAAYKHHIGLYPTPTALTAFKEEIDSYKNAKGSVQFPLDKPIPYDLIRKIVRFRVQSVTSK